MSGSVTFTVTAEALDAADGGILDPVEVSYFEALLQGFLNTADVALRLSLTASDINESGCEGTRPPDAGPAGPGPAANPRD
jgi:hypothetical protein